MTHPLHQHWKDHETRPLHERIDDISFHLKRAGQSLNQQADALWPLGKTGVAASSVISQRAADLFTQAAQLEAMASQLKEAHA